MAAHISEPLLYEQRAASKRLQRNSRLEDVDAGVLLVSVPSGLRKRKLRVLLCCYGACFAQYAASMGMSPFFPTSPAGRAVGEQMVGVVFSAQALAHMLAAPLPPFFIDRVGMRSTIMLGGCISFFGLLGFGVMPLMLLEKPAALAVALVSCRLLFGFGCALSEAAVLTLASMIGAEDGRTGLTLSSIEVINGVAASVGGACGGVLYQVGDSTPFGSFLFPFIVASSMYVVLVPATYLLLPGVNVAAEKEEAGEIMKVNNLDLVVAGALLVIAIIAESMSPILEPHMRAAPRRLSNAQVGVLFSVFAMAYTLGALPSGVVTDRLHDTASNGRMLKIIMLFGWLGACCAFYLVGPGAGEPVEAGQIPASAFVSFAILGASCAVLIVPSLPLMQAGLEVDDEKGRAAMCALWNGLYACGSFLGPIFSASLYALYGFEMTCKSLMGICVLTFLTLLVSVTRRKVTPKGDFAGG